MANYVKKAPANGSALLYYYEVVSREYELEMAKKQSLENRAGLIITILTAICIFIFDKINVSDLVYCLNQPLTFILLIKILSLGLMYLGFTFTLVSVISTIAVRTHSTVEVSKLSQKIILEDSEEGLKRIIDIYKTIICQHRDLNIKRAEAYKKTLFGITTTILCIVVYVSL